MQQSACRSRLRGSSTFVEVSVRSTLGFLPAVQVLGGGVRRADLSRKSYHKLRARESQRFPLSSSISLHFHVASSCSELLQEDHT